MNEQIWEIHRQVILWADTPNCPDMVEWDTSQIPEEYTKKFAELIVRECIRVPYDMWDKSELNVDMAIKIENRIKKHFGVEE